MLRLLTTLTVAAALLTGCGNRASIERGGRVPGEILTVYTVVPQGLDGTDLIRGAKLALAQTGGRVGELTVQFASARTSPGDVEGVAGTVRDVVRDTGTIAVIADLDTRTAAVTAPLLNAVGLLHVSPLARAGTALATPTGSRTFFPFGPTAGDQAAAVVAGARGPFAVEAEPGGEALAAAIRARAGRTVPTQRARTVVYAGEDPDNARGVIDGILRENRRATVVTTVPVGPRPRVRVLGPATVAPPGFAAAFPGVTAGRYAAAGFDAMNAVLAAVRRAGAKAQTRQAVIRAFRAPAAPRLRLSGAASAGA